MDEEAFHEDAETINQPSEASMTERALQNTDNIDNAHVTEWMGRTEATRPPEDLRISSATGPELNTYTRRWMGQKKVGQKPAMPVLPHILRAFALRPAISLVYN